MAQDTAADTPGFEFNVEDVGPARKRLNIVVTADTVNEKVDASMGSLQTEAALPGFRKGRAPRHLIERRFGDGLKQDARNQLASLRASCERAASGGATFARPGCAKVRL